MTLADIIILIILIAILTSIFYAKYKHKDDTHCASCAYAIKNTRKK